MGTPFGGGKAWPEFSVGRLAKAIGKAWAALGRPKKDPS
jgi:hypothetical protein